MGWLAVEFSDYGHSENVLWSSLVSSNLCRQRVLVSYELDKGPKSLWDIFRSFYEGL